MFRYSIFFSAILMFASGHCPGQPTAPGGVTKEVQLVPKFNAYNPIPSPDGKNIGFVVTGWDFKDGSGCGGLMTNIMVMSSDGTLIRDTPLATVNFLAGWSSDSRRLVCFRDYQAFLISLAGLKSDEVKLPEPASYARPERVTYIGGNLDPLAWRTPTNKGDLLETSLRLIAANSEGIHHLGHLGELLSASPDGRYIAIPGILEGKQVLWVYDLKDKAWHNLGPITIHPDPAWDYVKPSWNPWAADSSHLAFVSDGSIVLATPDGKSRSVLAKLAGPAGMAVCAPDSKSVAYVTFEPTPVANRPDLHYFGNTTVWVVDDAPQAKPIAVAAKSEKRVFDLNWLGNGTLVFDRVGDKQGYEDAHLWKVELNR